MDASEDGKVERWVVDRSQIDIMLKYPYFFTAFSISEASLLPIFWASAPIRATVHMGSAR